MTEADRSARSIGAAAARVPPGADEEGREQVSQRPAIGTRGFRPSYLVSKWRRFPLPRGMRRRVGLLASDDRAPFDDARGDADHEEQLAWIRRFGTTDAALARRAS